MDEVLERKAICAIITHIQAEGERQVTRPSQTINWIYSFLMGIEEIQKLLHG